MKCGFVEGFLGTTCTATLQSIYAILSALSGGVQHEAKAQAWLPRCVKLPVHQCKHPLILSAALQLKKKDMGTPSMTCRAASAAVSASFSALSAAVRVEVNCSKEGAVEANCRCLALTLAAMALSNPCRQ